MDPLSVAASVVGLVTIGQEVVSFVHDLIKNAVEYPKEFGDLARELRGLCCLLTAIRNEKEFMKNNTGDFRNKTSGLLKQGS